MRLPQPQNPLAASAGPGPDAQATAVPGFAAPARWERTRLRLIVDVGAMIGAMWLFALTRDAHIVGWTVVFAAVAVGTMAVRGGYRRGLEDSLSLLLVRHVLYSTLIALMVTTTLRSLAGGADSSLRGILVYYVVGTASLAVTRVVREMRDRHIFRTGSAGARAVVVGEGGMAGLAARRLIERADLGITPIGYVIDGVRAENGPLQHHTFMTTSQDSTRFAPLPVLGDYANLARIIADHRIDVIFVAFLPSPSSDARLSTAVATALEHRVKVFAVPRLFDVVNGRTVRHRLGTLPMDEFRAVDPRSNPFRAKYAVDRVLGSLALVLVAPLLLTLALLVKLSSPGPVLYRQRRVGLDGQEFDILKFRSMRVEEPAAAPAWVPKSGQAPGGVEGHDRRTSIGRFLRRTNLDELPQLLNIARGDMCIVGPRPERPEFVALFCEELRTYDARHRVKAGLTGWSQVNGFRGRTSIADRADWDNYYIENWSFSLDISIIIGTVKTFFQDNE